VHRPGRYLDMTDIYGPLLAILDSRVPDPAGGLPEDFFLWVSRFVPLVNVDLLIRNAAGQILLTWRDDPIHGRGWHVPGGIIRYRETAEARIHATAIGELGADVEFDSEPIATQQAIDRHRRERAHFVSLVYRCRLLEPPDEKLRFRRGTPERGQWAWHGSCPPDLIPDQAPYQRFFQ
jgi:colanic acid biosynthesis protein WcaH